MLRYKISYIPIKKPDGTLVSSYTEKAEPFKLHLSDIFQPHSDVINADSMNMVEMFFDSPLPLTRPVKPFTPNDIKYTIRKYSLNK